MNVDRPLPRRFLSARRVQFLGGVAVCLVLALVASRPALGQQPQPIQVSGRVAAVDGAKLFGVTVRILGTNTTTVTAADGSYAIAVPPDAGLLFTLLGYRTIAAPVAGRTSVDVVMERWIAVLPEVVVTGYQSQRRAELTGAVSSVDVRSVTRQTSASLLQRLDGQAAGVTVEHGGSPGSRTTVRIRGISSFQNNDPLYVVDGTPLQDTYLNWLNPDDIASVDVLKDASAASIYGSRASNGVIVIETKRGRPGRQVVRLEVKTGVATPVKGYDDILILNSLDYFQVVRTAYRNAGLNVPGNVYGNDSLGNEASVPAYIWPNDGVHQTTGTLNTSQYSYPGNLITPGSSGTNWWKAVFGAGQVRNATLSVSGGREDNTYLVSFNYLDQQGTAAFSRFQRGGIRVNTDFGLDRFTIGENLSVTRERSYGGMDDSDLRLWHDLRGPNFAPDIMQQPVVPIYDIAGHYAAGHNVPGLPGLNNPLKVAWVNSQNVFTNSRIFGNVFAGFDASHGIALRTQLGLSLGQRTSHGFRPTFPENPGDAGSAIRETYNLSTDWTWSNTVSWVRTGFRHNVSVLLGQEASKNSNRFESGSCASLLSEDTNARYIQDALCDPNSKSVFSFGATGALLSLFGKADYNFGDRYYLSLTLRRDGSSRFGPTHRWGTFPSFGAGWRLSREAFLAHNSVFSNIMLRFGFGITGNQEIPPGRIVHQFGGDQGDTFYDIGGTNTSLRPGFKVVKAGNPNLKWEENRSVNVGLDLEFLGGRGSFSADVYERKSNNLFFDPRTPATAGSAVPPIVNIGEIRNNGVEFSIGYRGTIAGSTLWSATFHGSHYRNKIVRIDANGTTAFSRAGGFDVGPEVVINQIGQPIGAFYGLVADGYYRDSAEAAPYWNDGARPGRIKFKDLNGDGTITPADRAVIGSPHPDFTADLDLALHLSHWDVSATLFGTFGNKIFNAQKRFYVFGVFSGGGEPGANVRNDLLTNSAVLDGPCNASGCSGKLTNPGAKYPRVDVSDVFSGQYSSYYVENGSYIRLRVLQVAYNLPPVLVRWIPVARIYVQAENLFTITGYSGPDPALPAWDVTGPAGDIRDQYRGVDGGSYPSNRTITIGISTTL
jgi:TonB-linked SusC/RagA family outer membrane protein